MTDKNRPEALDLIWGVSDIARIIGRTERQAFHLLSTGQIPGARKVGNRWVVSRAALVRLFMGDGE